jgi:hypothetical protein
MKNDEILNHLNAMSEDEMIEAVIVPLYQKRFSSFFDVEFSGKDKREDGGIDITYYETGRETGAKEYCGVQVKQGDINTGKSANGIAAISIQAQQAFNKPIANTRDKKNYRIQGYTVLTTGNIQAKARSQIVDQFEHKTIRFVDGKTLCGWIREDWLEEIRALCGTVDEHEEDEDLDPVAAIVEHLEKRCARDIAEIRETYDVVDGSYQDIIKALMVLERAKATRIAAYVKRKVDHVKEDLDAMRREDLVDIDEDGYSLNSISRAWSSIRTEAEDRIETLGYGSELKVKDVVDSLF